MRVQKTRDSAKERRKTDSVLFCGSLLWNTSVTRIKRLIDIVFVIDILEYIGCVIDKLKKFKVSKYFVNTSVLLLIEKC